ncbi:hypothetical protein CRUP_036912 [Coryphaenoides rupestris]|nr:hypothetical protein CRUP_036912 [Coryphaenoides rupestris]
MSASTDSTCRPAPTQHVGQHRLNMSASTDSTCRPAPIQHVGQHRLNMSASTDSICRPAPTQHVGQHRLNMSASDCAKYFNISSCHLTYNRDLYNQSDAVIIFHKKVFSLKNLPPQPRPPFQRWIWFHMESPTHTDKTPGLENLFNLTLNYRRDADISVRYNDLAIQTTRDSDFVVPKKDKLLCWIVSNTGSKGAPDRIKYYNQLKKLSRTPPLSL